MYIDIDVLNRSSISSIETFFDKLLRGTLTDNLFFGELPVNLSKDWKEVVVVDCGNPVYDHDAYSNCTVLVYIFAKQNPYGIKDVKRMQEMERKLNELILNNSDEHYHISHRGSYQNYDAVNDMFFNIVQIHLITS